MSAEGDDNRDRSVIVQIINMLKEMPYLWDTSDPYYTNKDRRNDGYQQMLAVFRLARPNASLKDIRKKVDNLKSKYKAESAKVKKSMGTGSESGQVYTPTLWYFDYMHFLDEKPSSRAGRSTLEDDKSQVKKWVGPASGSSHVYTPTVWYDHTHFLDEKSSSQAGRSTVEDEENQDVGGSVLPDVDDPSENVQNAVPVNYEKRRKISLQRKQHQLLDTAAELLNRKEDECELAGKYFGSQLKLMTSEQRMIAQKMISDCLYYGGTNQLNHSSYVELNNGSTAPPYQTSQSQNVGSTSEPPREYQYQTSSASNSPQANPEFSTISPQQNHLKSALQITRPHLRFAPYQTMKSPSTCSSASTSQATSEYSPVMTEIMLIMLIATLASKF